MATAVADLVRSAGNGEQAAWDQLVERYAPLVWGVARSHRLATADAADVSQTVWLRLVEHLGTIREPQALPGWLVTTTRHECLRTLRRAGRELPDEDVGTTAEAVGAEPSPEALVVLAERRDLVWQALELLSDRCQALLRALSCAPDASYAEVSAALGMPVGSIGPTRARCLEHLKRRLLESGAMAGDDGA